jgi:hypothetical protein
MTKPGMKCLRPRSVRSPLQGGLVHNPFPGQKTWAVLSDHFVVEHFMPGYLHSVPPG